MFRAQGVATNRWHALGSVRHHIPGICPSRPCLLLALLIAVAFPVGSTSQETQASTGLRFFDWTTLRFPRDEYQDRRQAMLDRLRAEGGGVLLIPSASGESHGETFRQLDDFLYFSGLELPRSILALDADETRTILFAPRRDPRTSA